ncbi:hypothetical protein GF318_06245 [Candidatus Micrarchaeota archaeon]|nr:hypothetical protein [Candidatus Micrarchaeota archaeon]
MKMQKLNDSLLRGVEAGNKEATAIVSAVVETNALTQQEIIRAWESAVQGVLKGSKGAAKLGFGLADKSQDAEAGQIYEDLVLLAFKPTHKLSFSKTISTGAAVVRVQNGNISCRGFDPDKFLELAKKCLINAAKKGNDYSKRFAVEALRNFNNREGIKEELLAIAQGRNDEKLMGAVFESLMHLRVDEELEVAQRDRKLILDNYDETSPGRLYAEMLFDSIETVLRDTGRKEREQDVTVATMQLARSNIKSEAPGEMLDEVSIKLAQKNIENALIHAMVNGEGRSREEACEGLASIGGERVSFILDRISKREIKDGTPTRAGDAARTTLLRIHKKEKPTLPPPIPPAAVRKEKARKLARR